MFKFASHNVRGINKQTDQDNILQECKRLKIDILGLCETKLTSKSAAFSFQNQNEYKTFHTCNDTKPFSAGITLLIHKSLAKHIHQIKGIDGRILIVKFLFKGRRTLYIIQIYLPNNRKESNELQNQVLSLLRNKSSEYTEFIIMGDFNATNNPQEDRKTLLKKGKGKEKEKPNCRPEISIFTQLEDRGFIDVHKNWEESILPNKPISHTWKSNSASSRIDYIWISSNLYQNNLHSFINSPFNHITNSDHTLLKFNLYTHRISNFTKEADLNRKSKNKRLIYDYKSMNEEK